MVVEMVSRGCGVREIAVALALSEPTVRAHYAEELATPRPQLDFPFAGAEPRLPRRRRTERMGRPEHVPDAESRERVEVLVAGGMPQWQIAAAIGISEPTLVRYYPNELGSGRARKTAQVIEALFRAATEGANVTAQKTWLTLPGTQDVPPAPREMPVGKKQAALSAARSAAEGTSWASIVEPPRHMN